MKIGIFGGTFDPIHTAHLMVAEAARQSQKLDEVWFMPAYAPPQKQGVHISLPKDRLEMVRLAIAGHPHFRVTRLELDRKGTSYTVDTLRDIQAAHLEDEIFLIIGGDSLADFLTWKDPGEILKLAKVIAVNRGRAPLNIDHICRELGEDARERIVLEQMTPTDISATDLRERSKAGRTIRYEVPRSVEMYIQTQQLYKSV